MQSSNYTESFANYHKDYVNTCAVNIQISYESAMYLFKNFQSGPSLIVTTKNSSLLSDPNYQIYVNYHVDKVFAQQTKEKSQYIS